MKLKKLLSLFLSICMLPVFGVQAEEKLEFDGYVFEDFESPDSDGEWFNIAPETHEVSTSQEHAVSGSRSLKFAVNRERTEIGITSREYSRGGHPMPVGKYFGMWVYGNKHGNSIFPVLSDAESGGQMHLKTFTVDWQGWKYLEWQIPTNKYKLYHIVFKKNNADNGYYTDIFFDDFTVSNVSYFEVYGEDAGFVNDTGMAGSVGQMDSGENEVVTTTLDEIDQEPPTRTSPQPNQLNNENPLKMISYKKAIDLPNNIAGVAFNEMTLSSTTPETRGVNWAAPLANDGMERKGKHTPFSGGLNNGSATDEYLTFHFNETKTIKSVNIIPRSRGMGYPVDYTIDVSRDGKKWETVVTVTGELLAGREQKAIMDPVIHSFAPVKANYIRMHVTKLNGNAGGHYFQIAEFEAIDLKGKNVAIYTEGTTVEASNPLSTNMVSDWQVMMDDMIDAGVKWVNVPFMIPREEYLKNGNVVVPQALIDNIRYLKENGVNVTLRIWGSSGRWDGRVGEEAKKFGQEVAEAMVPCIEQLGDLVMHWQIYNEENGGGTSDEYIQGYVDAVVPVAKKIHELLPGAKVGVETALIDMKWTKRILDAGIGPYLDTFDTHIYKESVASQNIIENVGTFIQDAQRKFPEDQPYATYEEEFNALKDLLHSYNPKIELWCTEIAANVGGGGYNVTPPVQGKWLARAYIYHQMIGYDGAAMWWTLQPVVTGETEWGVLDTQYNRRDSWYAMKNVANTISFEHQESKTVTADFGDATDMVYKVFEHADGSYLIPYWVWTFIREQNTGKAVDIKVKGVDVKNAVAIDMFNGSVQELNYTTDNGVTTFAGMVARDYPVVIRINSAEGTEYAEFVPEEQPKRGQVVVVEKDEEEKSETELFCDEIFSSNIIMTTDSETATINGAEKPLYNGVAGVKPVIIDGVSYLPARFLSEAIGKHIYWLDGGVIIISDDSLETVLTDEVKAALPEYIKAKKGGTAQ